MEADNPEPNTLAENCQKNERDPIFPSFFMGRLRARELLRSLRRVPATFVFDLRAAQVAINLPSKATPPDPRARGGVAASLPLSPPLPRPWYSPSPFCPPLPPAPVRECLLTTPPPFPPVPRRGGSGALCSVYKHVAGPGRLDSVVRKFKRNWRKAPEGLRKTLEGREIRTRLPASLAREGPWACATQPTPAAHTHTHAHSRARR